MTTLTTCNVAPITAFIPSGTKPWDEQKVNHLYRRIGFGATRAMITEALSQSPSQVVDTLVDEAVAKDPTPAPPWAFWNRQQFRNAATKPFQRRNLWKNQMVDDLFKNNLRDRMTLFWSNHFVTEDGSYNSPGYLFQYYNLLQLHAMGNFKDFTRDIGLSNAMLIYLNGRQNSKNKPNENYARELYELFTLGVDNGYTQQDIEETARALTGYNNRSELWAPITFNENRFDKGQKTIFGKRGNWGYDDVIDILFEERSDQIAQFICTKLYKYFVSPEINEDIIAQLATTFIDNNFEIAPVLRRLFKSQHFFDENTFGVLIKSPADVQISFVKELDLTINTGFELNNRIRGGCSLLGQALLSPIDVAGWQGDTSWIGSSTLAARWDLLNRYIFVAWRTNREQFRTIATNIVGTNTNDAVQISKQIVDHFLSKELLNDTDYAQALEIFKDQVPDNYFEDGTWVLTRSGSVPRQVYELLLFIIKIPEFQLK